MKAAIGRVLARIPLLLARIPLLRRLFLASIWAPGRFEKGDLYGYYVRVILPITDAAFIYIGLGGALNSVPALREVYETYQADLIAVTFAFTGLVCLLGVAFPRLYVMEIIGKAFTLWSIIAFTIVLGVLAGPRAYVAGFMIFPLLILGFRLFTLRRDWARDPDRAHRSLVRARERARRQAAKRRARRDC